MLLVDHNVISNSKSEEMEIGHSTRSLTTDLLLSYDTLLTDLQLASDF